MHQGKREADFVCSIAYPSAALRTGVVLSIMCVECCLPLVKFKRKMCCRVLSVKWIDKFMRSIYEISRVVKRRDGNGAEERRVQNICGKRT